MDSFFLIQVGEYMVLNVETNYPVDTIHYIVSFTSGLKHIYHWTNEYSIASNKIT